MKALPHDEELEQAALACVLLKPELAPELGDALQPEAFYLERHQEIAKAYAALAKAERAIDLRTLQVHLTQAGTFELVGGIAYLAGLDMALPNLAHFDAYLSDLRSLWAKRRLMEVGQQIMAGAMNGQTPAETIGVAERALADVERGQLEAGTAEKVGDLVHDLTLVGNPSGLVGISSGISDLDAVTGGWRPGQLITLAGATGMGKTAAAVGFCVAAARAGKKALMISIEMTEIEVTKRCVSLSTGVPFAMLDTGRIPRPRMADVMTGFREWQDLPMWVCEDPQTAQSIAATARRQKIKHGLDFLVIDYLGLVKYAGAATKTVERLGEIAWSFKMLAKSLKVPVMQLHQLSREVIRRTPPKPILSDLRDSGHIENHSDEVIFAYRPAYYTEHDDHKGDPAGNGDKDPSKAELIVAKHRNGQVGKVDVVWIPETMTFRGHERQHDDRDAAW